jgi:hypothetical protein
LPSPIDGGRCVRRPRRRYGPARAGAGVPVFVDCCRAGIAELLAAGGSPATIELTIDAYPLDGDERAALWLWAIRRQATPAPDLDAAGCELLDVEEAR